MTTKFNNAIKVTSRNNIFIKRIRSLHLREERERTSLYYAEGVRFVAQAVRHNAHIEMLVICPSLLTNPFAHKLADRLMRSSVPTIEVTPEVLHSIALVDDPQGIGAVL